VKDSPMRYAIFAIVLTSAIFGSLAAQSAQVSDNAKGPQRNPTAHPVSQNCPNDSRLDAFTSELKQFNFALLQSLNRPAPSESHTTIITAILAALAVLGAAVVGIVGQLFAAKRAADLARVEAERKGELAKREALFRHTDKIVEYRLKQMELFYAPMFALMGQSKGLYEKLLDELAQLDSETYRMNQDGHLHVFLVGKDLGVFRLLDRLPGLREVRTVWALVDQIVLIGDSMTKIIAEHAGLASERIIDRLGQYLAHYAILSLLYKSSETTPYAPGWHSRGYYPRELDSELAADYHEVSKFIDQHAIATERILDDLSNRQNADQA
jgi:hypothetical protein